MKNRLTTEQRDAIVSRLTDKRLYNLLNAICPSYEYKLKTVRPSTVEVMMDAVEIFDTLIKMESDEALMYCEGLWDQVTCDWRRASEDRGFTPEDKDIYTAASLILFTVQTMITLGGVANLLDRSVAIVRIADRKCRNEWEEVEAAFQVQLPRALKAGLKDWIVAYSIFPDESLLLPEPEQKPQLSFSSSITLKTGRNKEEGRGNKVNLYRVIMALHRKGFFKKNDGTDLDDKDVFNSFGAMLGKDFSKYLDDLGTDNDHNLDGVKIFQEMEEAYAEYVNEK